MTKDASSLAKKYCARCHLRWITKTPKEGGRIGVRFFLARPLAEETIISSRSRRDSVSADFIFGVIDCEGLY